MQEPIQDSEFVNHEPLLISVAQDDAAPSRDPIVRRGKSTSRRGPVSGALLWFATSCALLIVMRFLVPAMVEEIQYSITRGRQRAEYDVATKELATVGLSDLSAAYQMVSQRVGPSVVHIRTVGNREPEDENAFQFLSPNSLHPSVGQGSGVIIDEGGYILTNQHVVRGSKTIRVRLSDGRELPAHIVGEDSLTDLTVLKIDADKLIAAKWGDSQKLKEGALVWAVGSPFGLERSITFGILSAKNRAGFAGTSYQDFLQTDAAVNPGNSGGPLVNAQGDVIGVNTAIVGQTYRGISFAIPSEIAQNVYERIKSNGHVSRGWLGVRLDDVSRRDVKRLKLEDSKGALVVEVVDDPQLPSPAKDAGLRADDVIIQWDGEPVDTAVTLMQKVGSTQIGVQVEMIVVRNKQRKTFSILVGERPSIAER